MKRLTGNEKGLFYYLSAPKIMNYTTKRGQEEYLSKLRSAVIDKLGQLEDLMESYRIEDQGRLEDLISAGLIYESISKDFGIGLDILFKALKDGVWYIDEDGMIKFARVVLHSQFELELMIPYRYLSFCLIIKSYGKNWALTKEELE